MQTSALQSEGNQFCQHKCKSYESQKVYHTMQLADRDEPVDWLCKPLQASGAHVADYSTVRASIYLHDTMSYAVT